MTWNKGKGEGRKTDRDKKFIDQSTPQGMVKDEGQGEKIRELKYLGYGFIPNSFVIVHCLLRLSSFSFQVLFHISSHTQKCIVL